jgi:hypothetical protein
MVGGQKFCPVMAAVAESPDGPWTLVEKPVVEPGPSGSEDNIKINVSSTVQYRSDGRANALVVRLDPPPRLYRNVAGRKFAWHGDYWRTLAPTGIWKPIRLVATGALRLDDVYPISRTHEGVSATVNVQIDLANHNPDWSGRARVRAVVRGKGFAAGPYGAETSVPINGGETTAAPSVRIPEARLWWPWELGLPNRYVLETSVFDEAGVLSDHAETLFGIRHIRMERNPGYTEAEVHHPSLVLLEGGEEMFYGSQGLEYNAEFLVGLEEAIRPYTDLPYVPPSPLNWPPVVQKLGLGGKKDSGHTHALFYGMGGKLMEDYVAGWDYAVIPEFAVSSVPNVESLRRFIPPDELWPPGPSWGYHWADLDVFRVNDLYQEFNDCTLSVEITDGQGRQLVSRAYSVDEVLADSSARCETFEWKVDGKLGGTFRVAASLHGPKRRLLSANHQILPIADQEKAREQCQERAARLQAIKAGFHRADYYRFFPELSGPDRAKRFGDTVPRAAEFQQ